MGYHLKFFKSLMSWLLDMISMTVVYVGVESEAEMPEFGMPYIEISQMLEIERSEMLGIGPS